MEPRKAVGWLAAIVIAVGFILLLVPVSTGAGTHCGSALFPSDADALGEEFSDALSGFGDGGQTEACGSRRSTQTGIGWTVVAIGGLVGGYLVLTNSPAERRAAAANDEATVAER